MRYLIDGYNLAHAMGLLHGKVAPASVEVARRSLLVRLLQSPGLDPKTVIVVFDAQRAPAGTPARQDYQGIQVVNALRQEADDLIEDLIEHEAQPKQVAVVSDDHRIKDAARRRRCVPLGCLDFLEAIQQPPVSPRRATRVPDDNEKPGDLSPEELRLWCKRFGVEDEPDNDEF